jgi:hypothetical protein
MTTNLSSNVNFLIPTSFKMVIDSSEFGNLEYYITNVSLPSINVGEIDTSYRNYQGFISGEKLVYEALTCQFLIDEDMNNYKEVHDWLLSNTGESGEIKTKDLILSIFSSKNQPKREIRFVEAFPTNLEGIEFDTQAQGTDYLKGSVTFRYDRFEFIK